MTFVSPAASWTELWPERTKLCKPLLTLYSRSTAVKSTSIKSLRFLVVYNPLTGTRFGIRGIHSAVPPTPTAYSLFRHSTVIRNFLNRLSHSTFHHSSNLPISRLAYTTRATVTSFFSSPTHSELIVKYLEEKIPLYQFLRWYRGIAYLTKWHCLYRNSFFLYNNPALQFGRNA